MKKKGKQDLSEINTKNEVTEVVHFCALFNCSTIVNWNNCSSPWRPTRQKICMKRFELIVTDFESGPDRIRFVQHYVSVRVWMALWCSNWNMCFLIKIAISLLELQSNPGNIINPRNALNNKNVRSLLPLQASQIVTTTCWSRTAN